MSEVLSYKKILLFYVVVSIVSASIEILLSGQYFWSFWMTYIGTFFAAPYMRKAINSLFKHFHVKKLIRNLINPWIMYGIIAFYCYLFFSTQVVNPDYAQINFITFVGIIALILVSMPSLIRIVAVAFHRRRITIYPINRIEFAAMKYLKNDGYFKIFCHIPKWNEASIRSYTGLGFHACGRIRFVKILKCKIYTTKPERLIRNTPCK